MDTSTMVDNMGINVNRFSRFCDVMIGNGKSIIEFKPEIPCFINDVNTDVINFYKNIQDPILIQQLNSFINNWKLISEFSAFSVDEIKMAFHDFESGIISSEDLTFMLRAIIMMNMDNEVFNQLFEKEFVISIDMLIATLIKQIESGLIGLKGQNQKIEDCNFILFLEQTFKAGFYEHFKNLMNLQKTELIDCLTLNAHLTLWFFLKEFGKGKHLNYDLNGNIKNQYNRNFKIINAEQNLETFKNNHFVNTVGSAKISNHGISDFLESFSPTNEDILVANLDPSNLILSTGKNHSNLQNQYDLIRPLLDADTNILIKVNTQETADLILKDNTLNFQVINSNACYYIINFSLE